jgi:hypothetical protein
MTYIIIKAINYDFQEILDKLTPLARQSFSLGKYFLDNLDFKGEIYDKLDS